MIRIFSLTVLALFSISGHAATWYGFDHAYSDNTLFYFDQDTVVKQDNKITIWVKSINKSNFPNRDGSYAVAEKMVYSCNKRTFQMLTSSYYDNNQQFINSNNVPTDVEAIVPGTVAELILQAVCSKDFPNDKSHALYFPVLNNDIYTATKSYFAYIKAKNNDPAPK